MANKSVLIRVPATVGNFAGAVNCAAVALDASLNVKVTPRLDGQVAIRYFGENGERVPRDRSNLVVRAMEATLHLRGLEFTGADFEIYSSVPVAVGLGSSTAAVLAGLIAADRLFRLHLEEKTIFEMAEVYESRADNLQAAWYGGFVAGTDVGQFLSCRRTAVPENLLLSVVIPETHLAKDATRERPSERLARKDFSLHSQRAAALAEFFARPKTAHSPELDAPLPPTCEKSVPGLQEALKARTPNLLSVFACGSGPAVGILTQDEPAAAVEAVKAAFARHGVGSIASGFRPSNAGARDWNAVHAQITLSPTRALGGVSVEKSTLITG
jgi:homoserine kinase